MYCDKIKQLILLFGFLIFISAHAEHYSLTTSAIITNLEGAAFQEERQLQILDSLATGSTINVGQGSKINITFESGLVEYSVTGPAKILIEEQTLKMISGPLPESRMLFPQKNLRVKDGLFGQASTRTRIKDEGEPEFKIISPRRSFVGGNPTFRWYKGNASGPVLFTLMNAAAEIVYSSVAESGFQLPDNKELQPGAHYTWTISVRSNGRKVTDQADFVVTSAEDDEWLQKLTGCDSGVSRQVICALLLEQRGFREEAQTHWKYLQHAFPDNPHVNAWLMQ